MDITNLEMLLCIVLSIATLVFFIAFPEIIDILFLIIFVLFFVALLAFSYSFFFKHIGFF